MPYVPQLLCILTEMQLLSPAFDAALGVMIVAPGNPFRYCVIRAVEYLR